MAKIKRSSIASTLSLTPLIDVVFLLLIFFMLASTLVTTNAIDILLPKASGKTENKKSVAVSIKKDLSYYIDQKQIKTNRLEAELIRVLQQDKTPTIVLRAEKSVPVENVVRVMDIANRNKFKVILAVKPN